MSLLSGVVLSGPRCVSWPVLGVGLVGWIVLVGIGPIRGLQPCVKVLCDAGGVGSPSGGHTEAMTLFVCVCVCLCVFVCVYLCISKGSTAVHQTSGT